MVILLHSSDSTGTLVSLDERRPKPLLDSLCEPPPRSSPSSSFAPRASGSDHDSSSLPEDVVLYPTALFLPGDGEGDDDWCTPDDDSDDDDAKSDSSSCYYSCTSEPRPLYLPLIPSSASGSSSSSAPAASVESYLPLDVVEAAEDLLSQPPRHFTSGSRERVLYVCQGEIAHAVPLQCEVLVSDRATTCHVLALRSTSDAGLPLATVAHVDDACYDACLRDAVQRHYQHHTAAAQKQRGRARSRPGRNGSGSSSLSPAPAIRMDVHIVGGFADPASARISNWLIYSLATLAADYLSDIRFTLRTCAVSSLNGCPDDPRFPVGRGLAMDVRSGRVCLARADASLIPALELRSARLFRPCRGKAKALACVHDQTSNELVVRAFAYASPSNSHVLLELEDEYLLRCASTSPHCEEPDFCSSLRGTLEFLRDVPPSSVFGKRGNESAIYRRVGRSNQWRCLRGHLSAPSAASSAAHRLFGF
jgi:hypothetical protein